jgi:hypothetical protein
MSSGHNIEISECLSENFFRETGKLDQAQRRSATFSFARPNLQEDVHSEIFRLGQDTRGMVHVLIMTNSLLAAILAAPIF